MHTDPTLRKLCISNGPLSLSRFGFETRLDCINNVQNKLCFLKMACALFMPVQSRLKSKMAATWCGSILAKRAPSIEKSFVIIAKFQHHKFSEFQIHLKRNIVFLCEYSLSSSAIQEGTFGMFLSTGCPTVSQRGKLSRVKLKGHWRNSKRIFTIWKAQSVNRDATSHL